jgi:hypothetical protein
METGFDTLANFVNQEADYNFASGLEVLKRKGAEVLAATSPFSQVVSEPLNQDIQKFAEYVNQSAVGKGAAQGVQAMLDTGVDYGIPVGPMMGVIKSNFRIPEQIQTLRKVIAEEMRSRGPVGQVFDQGNAVYPTNIYNNLINPDKFWGKVIEENPGIASPLTTKADPFDLILRGTPYHGMTEKARGAIWARENYPATYNSALDIANETGFLRSLHNSQSMSNKWGEPAGVSTSFLPTKSGTIFSPDEYIHRLLPLYGGPPTERVVNLMLPEGRELIRDAYTGAFGKFLQETPGAYDILAKHLRQGIDYPLNQPFGNFLREVSQNSDLTGKFNLGLSNELQSMGKRGILYSPKRYDEYELAMLHPKYAAPLDYRQYQEYANPVRVRADRSDYSSPRNSLNEREITPRARRGLSQLTDIMEQDTGYRLGDIYSERPWQGYLNQPTRERLLERVGLDYREQVGNMLNDTRLRNLDIPY